jgi:hypothetical protein
MWEPPRLTTLWVFTASYRYSFFIIIVVVVVVVVAAPRFPAGERDIYFVTNVQTDSGGTQHRRLFLRGRSVRSMRLTTHFHLMSRLRLVKKLYLHSPIRLHGIVLKIIKFLE